MPEYIDVSKLSEGAKFSKRSAIIYKREGQFFNFGSFFLREGVRFWGRGFQKWNLRKISQGGPEEISALALTVWPLEVNEENIKGQVLYVTQCSPCSLPAVDMLVGVAEDEDEEPTTSEWRHIYCL